MNRWLWLALPLFILAAIVLLQPKPATQVEILPSFTLKNMDGQTVNLTDFKGRPIVLNAWATWCGPCRREMPLLVQAARSNPQINFVFLNISDSPVAVRAFERDLNLQIPNVLLDPEGRLSYPLRIQGLPATLFYDAEGKLLNRHLGEIGATELQQMLEAF
jgi:thiol-disulfide isomerase/thioredoxin